MQKITCRCDNIIEADFPDEIDLGKSPDYYDRILDGSFQSVTCPECGTLLKPELPVRLKDDAAGLDLLFLPENRRSDVLNGRLEETPVSLVVGFHELAERVRLIKEKIDPSTVEILKFFLKKKIGSDDVAVYFQRKDEDSLVFHILGLREDEVAITKLPEGVYLSTLESLDQRKDEELYSIILSPPYVSANKLSILEEEE